MLTMFSSRYAEHGGGVDPDQDHPPAWLTCDQTSWHLRVRKSAYHGFTSAQPRCLGMACSRLRIIGSSRPCLGRLPHALVLVEHIHETFWLAVLRFVPEPSV